MTKEAIRTEAAPLTIGPYSQAIAEAGWVFTAGQVGAAPDGRLAEGIEAQTRQALANLTAVFAAAGCSWRDVVKTTVYLRDMADFAAMNAVYGEIVGAPPPARSTVAAAGLPRDALVEIDAIAYRG